MSRNHVHCLEICQTHKVRGAPRSRPLSHNPMNCRCFEARLAPALRNCRRRTVTIVCTGTRMPLTPPGLPRLLPSKRQCGSTPHMEIAHNYHDFQAHRAGFMTTVMPRGACQPPRSRRQGDGAISPTDRQKPCVTAGFSSSRDEPRAVSPAYAAPTG